MHGVWDLPSTKVTLVLLVFIDAEILICASSAAQLRTTATAMVACSPAKLTVPRALSCACTLAIEVPLPAASANSWPLLWIEEAVGRV